MLTSIALLAACCLNTAQSPKVKLANAVQVLAKVRDAATFHDVVQARGAVREYFVTGAIDLDDKGLRISQLREVRQNEIQSSELRKRVKTQTQEAIGRLYWRQTMVNASEVADIQVRESTIRLYGPNTNAKVLVLRFKSPQREEYGDLRTDDLSYMTNDLSGYRLSRKQEHEVKFVNEVQVVLSSTLDVSQLQELIGMLAGADLPVGRYFNEKNDDRIQSAAYFFSSGFNNSLGGPRVYLRSLSKSQFAVLYVEQPNRVAVIREGVLERTAVEYLQVGVPVFTRFAISPRDVKLLELNLGRDESSLNVQFKKPHPVLYGLIRMSGDRILKTEDQDAESPSMLVSETDSLTLLLMNSGRSATTRKDAADSLKYIGEFLKVPVRIVGVSDRSGSS